VDPDHQLRVLGNWNAFVMDHLDFVLSSHDSTQATRARSYCLIVASNRTVRLVRFLVRRLRFRYFNSMANFRYRLIALGKVAKHSFPLNSVIPHVAHAGDTFYLLGLIAGMLMWAFALVWFVVAIIMIATAFPFPFNMGWWGFVFPVGKCRSTS
jgi:hypothetical protein